MNGNRGRNGRGIKLIAWNKGSSLLQNKHHEIETIISTDKPHVLGLGEANLKCNADLTRVQHQGYMLHTAPTMNNPDLGISRIVVYTHSSIVVKRRHDLEDQSISAIWLEVGLPRQKKILVANVYREWQYLGQETHESGSVQSQLQRWSVFLDKWESALSEGKEVMVLGDVNLDFLKWSRRDLPTTDSAVRLKPLTEQLFSRIFPHGVSQLVRGATRTWPGQVDAGLDHVYTNKPEKCSEVHTEFSGGSDHKLLRVTRFAKSLKSTTRYVRKRSFKNFDEAKFIEELKQLSWYDLYMTEDPNLAAEILTNSLNKILDELAPIKTIQVRTKYAAWLTDSTKELLKQRDDAQAKAALTRDQDDWRLFKNIRNTATAKMRAEKRAWEQHKLDNAQQSPSTLWSNVKSWLSWGNSGPPTKLFTDGEMVTSPARIAGTMNSFFINKVRLLRDRIPASAEDPLKKLKEAMFGKQCSLTLQPVTPEAVSKVIAGLKNSKSTGNDYIDTRIIKLAGQSILPAITHIINLSISHSKFPDIWKIAKVVPLLKKGDPLEPKNYRPVALLPVLSKILERAIFNQLVQYLTNYDLLNPHHHGSRQGHNTATALLQMYDQWLAEVEDGKMVGVMLIDLSAAFDMVDHNLLLKKLELFGFDNGAVGWIQSYLSKRYQSVCVDGCNSPPLAVEYGVPQGSILGPLLYILFTNDIPELVHDHQLGQPCDDCGCTVCYVDDTTYSYGDTDPTSLSENLTQQYKKISNYMAANNLVINADKTHLVVMGTKHTAARRDEVTLQADQHVIQPSVTEKLLGGVICEDLKWKEHLLKSEQSLIKQLTSRINGLNLVASRAPLGTRLMVANGIVMSKLCYLIQLWGGCEEYLLHSLQVLQNRAARAVTRKSWFTPTRVLLASCNWLSVKQLVVYQTLLTTHRTVSTGHPKYLSDRLDRDHPYQTRQATDGSIRFGEDFSGKQAITHSSFRYRAARDYNRIPAKIRTAKTIQTFKCKLRQWVSSNIPVT